MLITIKMLNSLPTVKCQTCKLLILKRMLSKYTFMAPNLIRVSGEGADYAYLITSASPPPSDFKTTLPTHH